ncbi:hypothetical protein N7465_000119 [Penicillium sp. CMV-2018d]|nr:hypothetical protein N7465_000119 [Penicillium sp. CMV-2018d]
MALPDSEGLTEYEAWRQAVIQYNQQRGGDADPTTLANTSAEIPLGGSVLTTRTTPPSDSPTSFTDSGNLDSLNHPPPDVRENTERLVDSGVVTKLCTDRTLDASLLKQTETQGAPQDNAETDERNAQEAHMRYWAAIGGGDNEIGKRL